MRRSKPLTTSDFAAGFYLYNVGRGRSAPASPRLIDRVQTGLAVVGLAPGLGEVADGIIGAISLFRGDFTACRWAPNAAMPQASFLFGSPSKKRADSQLRSQKLLDAVSALGG